MTKKNKILLIVAFVFVAIGFSGYYYAMNAGTRNIASETADFTVSSEVVFAEFTENLEVANKKYLDKAVAITGKISAIENMEIILDDKINCSFIATDKSFKTGQEVTIKGRVVGFDDLFGNLKLDQCVVNK